LAALAAVAFRAEEGFGRQQWLADALVPVTAEPPQAL
jgi:hypothetical protein